MKDIFEGILGVGCMGISCLVQIGLFLIGCTFVLWFLGVI